VDAEPVSGTGQDTGTPIGPDTTEVEKAMAMLVRLPGVTGRVPLTNVPLVEILGYAAVLTGLSLEASAVAVALGVGVAPVGVTVAGMAILGAGFLMIGGAYITGGQAIRSGRGG
jgi:hypothetical protein